MGCIYVARNKVNGKAYVGQTKCFTLRKNRHLKAKSNARLFNSAVKKYGADAWEWEVLIDGVESKEELDRLEAETIERLGTLAPAGYNLIQVGRVTRSSPEWKQRVSEGARRRNADPAYRERFVEANAQRWHDPEFRARHAAAMKESSSRPEWRAKMAAIAKTPEWRQNVQAANAARSLPVRCIETGVIYHGGASEAARETGVNGPNITQCCKGKRASAGGLSWEYVT